LIASVVLTIFVVPAAYLWTYDGRRLSTPLTETEDAR
jgi:hypothetical protein